MPGIILKRFPKILSLNSGRSQEWQLFRCILYRCCYVCNQKTFCNRSKKFNAIVNYKRYILNNSSSNGTQWNNEVNYLNNYFSQNFTTLLYPLREKEEKHKFYDEFLGNCEVSYRKDEMGGRRKIVVCEKQGRTTKNIHIPSDVNILKLLGAIALTLLGIIVAAYGTVLFVSLAANVIVLVAIISFIVISYRIIKDRIFPKKKF